MCCVPIRAQCLAFLLLLETLLMMEFFWPGTFASGLVLHQTSAHKLSPRLPLRTSLCHLNMTGPSHCLLPPPDTGVAPLNFTQPQQKSHTHTHKHTYTHTHRVLVYSSEKNEWQGGAHFHQESISCMPDLSHHDTDTTAADSKMLQLPCSTSDVIFSCLGGQLLLKNCMQ